MSRSLLGTKLHIPHFPVTPVARLRLHEKLNQGLRRKFTLVSAPAGFGKTTLVIDWLHTLDLPVGWLSLNEDDNDINRFLTYWIAALQTIESNIGISSKEVLQSSQSPQFDVILASLINDIILLHEDFVLVLDDYHLVTSDAVDDALQFWIEHMPSQMHLVMITREDPDFRLSRLRGQSQIVELRGNDLRFTPDETHHFLNQLMGLNLSVDNITALEKRTEGWITGLQLAAISMQSQDNHSDFIASFTGSHSYILDYLVEEILQQQSQSIQRFLLQTSILTRLSGSLCDALLADPQQSGQSTLEFLEQANLLVMPLDDQHQWYRYHHLFADALQTRLMIEYQDQVKELHQRASSWFEQHHAYTDAIRHAFASEDFERTATIIEQAWPIIRQSYHESTLRGWVKQLPDDIVNARPMLGILYSIALFPIDSMMSEIHLQNVEQWIEKESLVISNEQLKENEFRSLQALVAFARAYQSIAYRKTVDTLTYAQRALELLPNSEHLYRGSVGVILGLAHWATGDLQRAYQSIADNMSNMKRAGSLSAELSTMYLMADICLAQGHLSQANDILQRGIKLVSDHDDRILQGTADLYVLLSEVNRERNQLDMAITYLKKAQELGLHAALQEQHHRWYVAMARIKEQQAAFSHALELLDEAEHQHVMSPTPEVRPISAQRVRIWIQQGRLTEAIEWKNQRNLSADKELAYVHEFEYLTLIRLQIAQYRALESDQSLAETEQLLDRLSDNAQAGRRISSRIEILILKALIYQLQDAQSNALVSLEKALQLAEPEGYVRIFLNEGRPMQDLLQEAASRQIKADYTRKLLLAFSEVVSNLDGQTTDQFTLVEPLSEREIEILDLIAQGHTNQQIADKLYLSLYTIKAHARNIYGKLDVGNRTQAVNKARQLGILSPN